MPWPAQPAASMMSRCCPKAGRQQRREHHFYYYVDGRDLEATASKPGYLMIDTDTVSCAFKDFKSGECRNALHSCVSNTKRDSRKGRS